jgi:hypothetical protein
MKYLFYGLILFAFLLVRCDSDNPSTDIDVRYSFFAAGHVYGNPITYDYGVHSQLDSNFFFLNNYSTLDFGVFTGDVVPKPTNVYWDSLQIDLAKLDMPYYIAPGNHDRGEEFRKRYSNYYQSFYHDLDLFITLSPTNWNIDGEQLNFLEKVLLENTDTANNIFIFCHELIWWSPDNQFQDIDINWEPHYPGSSNYWDVVDPLLRSVPNNVVVFAGDIGCNSGKTPCMYYRYENIELIASGMGGGDKDNLIITEVHADGSYDFNLIHLNGDDKSGMGMIYDYSVK